MRINVYGEEITDESQLVQTNVGTPEDQRTFHGIRFYLKSPEELHNNVSDDDRSAITLWIPWTLAEGHNKTVVQDLLRGMLQKVQNLQV